MSNNIRDQLGVEDKNFLNQVEDKLKEDDQLLHQTCNFVVDKVGGKAVTDFKSLEPADKLQACLDHLAISLVSGNVSQEEINGIIEVKNRKKR